jgi:integrase/recombinase XerD
MQPHTPAVQALAPGPAPVEYAVAVDRYLAGASLGAASRRVYRISLTSWAWPLVGRQPPRGPRRRGAVPPVVPLALLDRAGTRASLAAAVADRAAAADVRTVNRELSALRSAAGWWQDQGWISSDPTAGIRHVAGVAAPLPPLTDDQVTGLFGVTASLREQAFWRVLYDTTGSADGILGLDAGHLDLHGHRARTGPPGAPGSWLQWSAGTSQLLGWLLAGRRFGPVFLTERKAPGNAVAADICPVTGRARMSYRRAAEIFTAVTRPLDPAGRGWTLHQLRRARLAAGL